MDSLLLAYPETFIVIRYHTWWPSGNDPFHVANIEENSQRVRYYPTMPDGYYYTPRMFLDGFLDGETDADLWEPIIVDRAQVESSLEIILESTYGKVKATIAAVGDVPQTDLVARFVITESHLQFNAPNGVQIHDQTMRDMVPDLNGIPFDIQQGEDVALLAPYDIQDEWAVENCKMVVFVQSEATREILQTAQCDVSDLAFRGLTLADSEGNGDGKPDPGETVHLTVVVENKGPAAMGNTGHLTTTDPSLTLLTDQVPFDDIGAGATGGNASDPFIFSVAESIEPHYANFNVTVALNHGADTVDVSFTLVIGHPAVLVVDDATPDIQTVPYYKDPLDDLEGVIDQWPTALRGAPDASRLNSYEVVVWNTEGEGASLSPEEQEQLASFLDAGGRLFLCGDNLAAGLGSSSFLKEYLHADLVTENSGDLVLSGIQGDIISGDVRWMSIGGVAGVNEQPDVLAPLEGAIPFFKYAVQGGTAALRYGADYKVVYFAFGFEGIIDFFNVDNSPALRADLMQRILNYLRLDFNPQIGDVNEDGLVNILDVLFVVNIVLGIHTPTPGQSWAADTNEDGVVNILDAITLVNMILG